MDPYFETTAGDVEITFDGQLHVVPSHSGYFEEIPDERKPKVVISPNGYFEIVGSGETTG